MKNCAQADLCDLEIQQRHAEGTLCLSHNKKAGWKNKGPLQELFEIMDGIFVLLNQTFEDAVQRAVT